MVRNILTVDVEDYFMVSGFDDVVGFGDWERFPSRIERNTKILLDVFEEHDIRATFFVLGWIGQRTPALVREIVSRGHEVASHGLRHELVYNMSPAEYRSDVRKTKAILEDASGMEVRGYRAPSYSITRRSLWALEILAEEGHRYDSSIFPILHDRYGIPDFVRKPVRILTKGGLEILEVPISTMNWLGFRIPFGGGGYLRLYPPLFTEWAIRRINMREGLPAVVYIHPWEVDPGQPRIPGRAVSRARHYVRLGQTLDILKGLLARFSFGPLEETMTGAGSTAVEEILEISTAGAVS